MMEAARKILAADSHSGDPLTQPPDCSITIVREWQCLVSFWLEQASTDHTPVHVLTITTHMQSLVGPPCIVESKAQSFL